MIETVYENALYEVSEILYYLNEDSKKNIPEKLIEYIEENKSTNYNFEIDKSIPITEQKLLPETEAIITIIYRDYICEGNKKDEINNIINKNDIEYEENLKSTYDYNNMYKEKYNIENGEKLPIVIKKESLWYRIINRIKRIFINNN